MKISLKLSLAISLFVCYSFFLEKESTNYTVKITVQDSLTKEPLLAVTALSESLKDASSKGASSDIYGLVTFFSPKGQYKIELRYVGYQSKVIQLDLRSDTAFTVLMKEETAMLDEVRVVKKRSRVAETYGIRRRSSDYKTPVMEGIRSEPVTTSHSFTVESKSVSAGASGRILAGTLTAGEINDFAKWTLWEDLSENEFKVYKAKWDLEFKARSTVQVLFQNGYPIADALVELYSKKGAKLFTAKTDNTGKAELWYQSGYSNVKAKVIYKEEVQWVEVEESPKHMASVRFNQVCAVPEAVDIAFVVDATGSMGDEINYLKEELADVIVRASQSVPEAKMRTSAVFYRDRFDEYLVRSTPLCDNLDSTLNFIQEQWADGGGDFPEAVESGLEEAIVNLGWSKEARARILFLLLDAPPHEVDSVKKSLNRLVRIAAQKGIRIIPVTGSGIDKSTEFLMRSLALMTNGTYTFLTDHSGVGGTHLKPSTDSYEVEKLNDLMVKLIERYAHSDKCQLPKLSEESPKDSGSVAKNEDASFSLHPVPTKGPITVEVEKAGGILSLLDLNGRILFRAEMKERKKLESDFSQLASGVYVFRYQIGEAVVTKKWIRH
ncbi:MAG: VWA domain-containing protein [Bacteroidetes bacterium]|nr:MAG: VWA domain-containing protein [Bacteroidota bacterium]